MRKMWWLAGFVLVAAPLAAQGPPDRPQVERLRQQVMQRFLEAYQTQAGLTPEQDRRFREVFRRSMEQRQAIQQREQALWRALEQQMRPGIAANPDSVTRLLDSLIAQRAALVEQARLEQREYRQFLSPVQVAQLVLMVERFQQQIQQIMRRRMEMPMPGRMMRDTMPAPPPLPF
jgi:hypothetical protein